MRRTYRSKKDVAGALDHKDILNFNDKSSVFDAFYIQNLKQTKRELSYVSSNKYVVASKKVRKRKYTKRIVKNADAISNDTSAPSAYLTPDKSIRVNKAFDPFDALLNSSRNTQGDVEFNKNDSFKNAQPKRYLQCTRQKTKNKPKKINYSSSGTDSEKENSEELSNVSHNRTDFRKHELLIEKDTKISHDCSDESINNILLNLPRLKSFKQNVVNESFAQFSLPQVTLIDNTQSPILKCSPFSSTPFKEKYRSQSIYKFSPIRKSYNNSSNGSNITEKSIIHNNSKVFVEDNKESELETHRSPIKHFSNNSVTLKETSILPYNIQENTKGHISHSDKSANIGNGNLSKNIVANTCIEVSSLHTTEYEPFRGFSNNDNDNNIGVIEENKENYEKEVMENANELCVFDLKCCEKSESITDSVEENVNNDGTIRHKSKDETEVNGINCISHDCSQCSISDSKENESSCIHLERQTLYDTCNNGSTLQETNRSVFREPIVRLERMNNSIFFEYLKQNLDISKNNNSSIATTYNLTDEDSNEIKNCQNEMTISVNHHNVESDSETSSTNHSTKSSIMESDGISSSDEKIKSANNRESCINFVTTRKRTEAYSCSVMSDFEYTNYSSSKELDQTACDNFTDNKTVYFNVSRVNTEDSVNINSNDEVSTLSNHAEKGMFLNEQSNTKCSESTYSSESNYYDNDSTDEMNMCTITSHRRLSTKNYSQHGERKHNTRKRSSRISRVTRSQNISEYVSHNNNLRNDDDVIEVISSDSAPEKHRDSPINARSLLGKMSDTVDLSKVAEPNSSDADEKNEVSLYAFPHNNVLDSDDNESSYSGVSNSCISRNKVRRITTKCVTSKKEYEKGNNVEQENTHININKETVKSNQESFTNEQKENNCNSINFSDAINNKDCISSAEFSNVLRKTILKENPATSSVITTNIKPNIVLEPGKKWERSLSIYRRMTMIADKIDQSILDEPLQMKGRKYRQSVISTMEMQDFRGSLHNESINSRRSTFISKPSRSTIKLVKDPNITRVSLYTTAVYDDLKGFLSDDCDDTIVDLSKLSIADAEPDVTVLEVQNTSNRLVTARDYVLRRCNQADTILFDECYPDTVLKNCHKIGEGVYGEVFLWRDRDGRARVMKIVPIAGHVKVNGECQKDFHEIISEIVIAMELSALRTPIADIERHFDEGKSIDSLDLHTIENATDVFNEVLAVRCVYGNYPSRLLDLWDLYDECKGSENDNPAILPVDQQYLVLELANAGQDLESYQFNNAEQAHALFLQIAFGLAVGEEAYQFEHRDLHWGNVLIAPTDQKFATFVLRGRGHRVPRCGVAATIIDYSLSRIALPLGAATDCAALYNDLANDDGLFDALGDYQFEVYRLMRDKLGNDWKNFEPYTNILWLHYVVDKMITALRYKRTNTKIHKHYIDKLKSIKNRILDYKSAVEFVLTDNEF